MRVLLVGLLAAAAIVAGCGDDDSPAGSRSVLRGSRSADGREAPSRRTDAAATPAAVMTSAAGRVACGNFPPGETCSHADAATHGSGGFSEPRLIVKLEDGLREPADVVHAHGRRFADEARSGGAELDALNARYRVRAIVPAFLPWFETVPAVPGRGALAERRRMVQESVTRSRAAFPARSRRAPVRADVPDLASVYLLEVPAGTDLERMAADYAANENVAYAVPDRVAEVSALPNDPYLYTAGSWGQSFADLWGIAKIGAPAAWDSATGLGVVVAVVDTGLDYNHVDIAANVWTNAAEVSGRPAVDDDLNGYVDDVRGWSFATANADVMDRHGHGTHVAGTVAAVGGNAVGVIGVAHQARILPVKALDDSGHGTFGGLANAITYAARNGADVISNSWGCYGGGCESAIIADAVALARSLGCVVTFAAGNDGQDVKRSSPANLQDVITVASTGTDDSTSSFSNYGWRVDVAAPGGGPGWDAYNVLSLRAAGTGSATYVVGTSYMRLAGTSMATPHVSGVAALLLSENPDLTVPEVESIIRHTAADQVGAPALDMPGYDVHYGWGRLDAAAAVARAFDPPADPPVLKVVAGPVDFVLPQSSCGQRWSLPLDLHNLGGGALDWSSSGPDWLAVTPPSGASGSLAVQATVDALSSRSGTLTLSALQGSPVELPVSEQVLPSVSIVNCDVAISRAQYDQQWGPIYGNFNNAPPAVPDGAGGAIIVWSDWRAGAQVYAQRVDSLGRPLWGKDGIGLSTPARYSQAPAIASDGAGGAFVAWIEGSMAGAADAHIRVQRVDADGRSLWGTLFVSQGAEGDGEPQVAADGAGGLVVSWIRYRMGYSEPDFYAQRLDGTGVPKWQAGGAPVTRAAGGQQNHVMTADGSGGAFFAWEDLRAGLNFWFIYGQHLGPDGQALWAADGIAISPVDASGPNILPDGSGGAIVAWNDFRSQTGPTWRVGDKYAQRIDGAGNKLWATDGSPIVVGVTAASSQFASPSSPSAVSMVGDGKGGALVVWMDNRNGDGPDVYVEHRDRWDIYAQHLDRDGIRLWGETGVPVTTAAEAQLAPSIVRAEGDGAIVAWADFRAGNADIFLQRLGAGGERLLGADGAWIDATAGGEGMWFLDPPYDDVGDQMFPYVTPLADHRVLVTWDDYRLGGSELDVVGKVIEFASDVAIAPGAVNVAPGGSVAFSASGGSRVGWRWSLATDASGGTIDPATGAYVAGPTWNVTDVVQVEDAFGNLATADVGVVAKVAIEAPTSTVPPRGRIAFSASGGSGTGWTWSLATNGSGGTIDADTGEYVAGATGGVADVVQVRDSWGIVATRAVAVTAGVSIAPAGATPPRGARTLSAEGGSGDGYAWAFVENASGGALDADTGLYQAGPAGSVVDQVQVVDALGNTATASLTVTAGVSITPPAPTLAPGSTISLQAEGGSGAEYEWSFVTNGSGATLVPAGSTFVAYAAGRTGDVTDVVEVVDSLGNTSRASIDVTSALSIAPPSPSVAPLATLELSATGGSGTGYIWLFSVVESGGSIDPTTGRYTAGPRGDAVDVVYVLDSLGNTGTVNVTVTQAIAVAPASATVQAGGTQAFVATGGAGTGYAWTLATNASGGTIDAATGAYAAGPTGGVTDVVQTTDALGNVGVATVEVTASPASPAEGGCGCGSGEAGGASLLLAAALFALAPRPARRRTRAS